MPYATGCAFGGRKVNSRPAPARHAQIAVANRKGTKKSQVVLTTNVPNLGIAGDLVAVQNGYMTNFLLPKGLAKRATQDILDEINAKIEADAKAKAEVKSQAKAMATALKTIGVIKVAKKAGENDQIFGSVQGSEIIEYIFKQTGRQLDKNALTLPEMKTLGTYEASIKLHPEVTGTFNVQITRAPNK